MQIHELIELGVMHQASDLHLSAGHQPIYRIDGDLRTLHSEKLNDSDVTVLLMSTMNSDQQQLFINQLELDYAFTMENRRRFRINAFRQQLGTSAAIRYISNDIKSFSALHLPLMTQQFCLYSNGLVLITGATGSGKSTTLASMIEYINQTCHKHILTIEDPIEIIYKSKSSLIQQREVKRDTADFASALHMALRQDPDIIMLGEMRDKETIRLALEAAETGHLVLATMHAASVVKAIDRIIQTFSSDEQAFVRALLSTSLRAVVAQELRPKKTGGRVAVCEVMVTNSAISNLIRENKLTQIYSTIQTGRELGMQTREQSIEILQREGIL